MSLMEPPLDDWNTVDMTPNTNHSINQSTFQDKLTCGSMFSVYQIIPSLVKTSVILSISLKEEPQTQVINDFNYIITSLL